MLKTFRAGILALAVACLAPFAAQAACPTAPTYTTLSGLDAAAATKTLQMLNGGAGFLATPLLQGWNGTAAVALTADANCNLQVSIPGSVAVSGTFWQTTQPASLADGAEVTVGSKADAATCATTNTMLACMRQLHADLIAATPDTAAGDFAAIRANTAAAPAAFAGTATTTVTRPANTTAYAVNQTWADSTSAPTSGGFTLSSVCSASGKTTSLTTMTIVSNKDPATTLQGEVWVFNSSVTAVNDGSAFALSTTDAPKIVGKFPFSLETSTGGSGTTSIFAVGGLDTHVTCSGSANLRFLIKVKNAYTPASAEQLQVAFAFKGDN